MHDGQPFVIPTSYGRSGDKLYVHGSSVSRMLKQMHAGVQVCITVTLLDGLVLARSIFNHSMNYRSVVVLGKATLVDDPEEKLEALRLLSEMQSRYHPAPLPGLTGWIAARAEPLVVRWHNRERRAKSAGSRWN